MDDSTRSRRQPGLRILMISDVYAPRVNGVSTSIASFRRELHAMGHRVTLVAPDYGNGGPVSGEDDPDVLRVPGRTVPGDPEDRLMRWRPLMDILRELDRDAIDLVHVQTPFTAHYAGTRFARERALPVLETYHTFFEEYFHHYVPVLPGRLTRYLARQFTRRQARSVNRLVVPSTALQQVLLDYGVNTPMHVLPTGLGPDDFRALDPRQFAARHGLDLSRPTLVHVGRIAHEKNIGLLIEMLDRVRRSLPAVQLVIAGEGPALGSIRDRVAALGLGDHVRFTGYLTRDGELQDCYACGDAFVFASKTETQGLVLLEAWACGVPLVSTARLGTRDILAPGRGALVAEDDPDDFAAAVLRLLGDDALRSRLAAEARIEARKWTSGRMAARLDRIYRALVSARRPITRV